MDNINTNINDYLIVIGIYIITIITTYAIITN
ncbi:hypothetical protein Arnit_3109 [Arcobacter nitrofigilis DSM 7299]|uniref:Uncharacterized protein n=1 Tax=Arcobacter nitrofigilis (strain ATCC 33309 / DSM 7299 / CCUG 15893 / LMG 7604 / NCTC 12251 / CI) TaxID=572480 RepID=D5V7Y6_ARCNC|nr:hypothetical protein Arnit_3109 [Arcobacter nitrofigilis DSM 7299]